MKHLNQLNSRNMANNQRHIDRGKKIMQEAKMRKEIHRMKGACNDASGRSADINLLIAALFTLIGKDYYGQKTGTDWWVELQDRTLIRMHPLMPSVLEINAVSSTELDTFEKSWKTNTWECVGKYCHPADKHNSQISISQSFRESTGNTCWHSSGSFVEDFEPRQYLNTIIRIQLKSGYVVRACEEALKNSANYLTDTYRDLQIFIPYLCKSFPSKVRNYKMVKEALDTFTNRCLGIYDIKTTSNRNNKLIGHRQFQIYASTTGRFPK